MLPSLNDLTPPPLNYDNTGHSRASVDHYAGSLAPSTNNVSVNDGLSAYNAPDTPLKLTSRHYEVHEVANDNPYSYDADTFLNRAASKLRIKSAFHWVDPRFFHERAWFGWGIPRSYQLPGHYYKSASDKPIDVWKHRDVFRRKFAGLNEDRYLNPLDGRVEKLFVQTISELYDTDNATTWRRTYIDNVSPWIIRLAYWPYSHMPDPRRPYSLDYAVRKTSPSGIRAWKQEQWVHVGVRWLPACFGLLVLMSYPTDIEGQVRNHGNYDPVPYRYWSYPVTARNFRENLGEKPNSRFISSTKDFRLSDRCLRPRLLCFLDVQTDDNPRGLLDPQRWIDAHGGGVEPTYIFVSYTAEKQFERRCREARRDIQETGSSSCACDACRYSAADAEALHAIAYQAARNAGVAAYWTDQCCMSSDKNELQDDVYRISDVTRGAAKIVVVVGRSGRNHLPPGVTALDLLREWGTRMWTWPEVLLGPAGEKIQVYTRGGDMNAPLEISKMEFPTQVWDDGEVARQLIDNYEGTLTLSRLELVILALECLKARVEKGTTKYLDGDLSYALMGLLRQRPKVDPTDSAFQAFSRLSLANDSDQLLERMICLLPVEQLADSQLDAHPDRPTSHMDSDGTRDSRERHYWANMNDYWGAKLWDIEPTCQVAGIGHDDTVILDGAHAATIHWDRFRRVAITTRETWSRTLARYFVRGTPAWFFTGVLTLAFAAGSSTTKGVGALFLVVALLTVLLSPMLILHIYGGKVWNTQPWLFGFEGHMTLRKIEMKIFGFPSERLSWAPYASNMSHHRVNTEFLADECEGTDPLLAGDSEPEVIVSRSGAKLRLFTLIDTNTMTVTTFRAARPPTIALLCGSEGGMQRAVLCSYDWTNQCLWRETVLRMETVVLEKMSRIGRVRFGLRRREADVERSYLRPP
ncbi:hypothetical protein A1O7_04610 [Cladophialophora yegresii CBS 114405]|uniref:Heterokaryon incompatibility domain-containing protein n=1 Tax=Cladophialophora yegresii CBS 114405 TaxID=1182544 RepID=W9VXA1_9EURO|nr:uncharacterized protein A1O7_04610 [Cladophialophora yegresii CBS 114405]EXJ60457.1 hypothetical protein A1O7_04610 [Cladophialophora yegresii CBS 114405]